MLEINVTFFPIIASTVAPRGGGCDARGAAGGRAGAGGPTFERGPHASNFGVQRSEKPAARHCAPPVAAAAAWNYVWWRLRCGGRQRLALAYLRASSVSEERRQPNRGGCGLLAFLYWRSQLSEIILPSKRATLPSWSFDIVNPLSLFFAFRR